MWIDIWFYNISDDFKIWNENGNFSLLKFFSSFSYVFQFFDIFFVCLSYQQLKLTPGTKMRDMFVEIPFPLDFRIYIWNVTNPDEVSAGGKPNLMEIGPYYFE